MMTSVSERRLDDTAPATGVPPSAASSGPTEPERRSQADLLWGVQVWWYSMEMAAEDLR